MGALIPRVGKSEFIENKIVAMQKKMSSKGLFN